MPELHSHFSLQLREVTQVIKNPLAMQETGDAGSVSGSGKASSGENGNPLQYYCLVKPMGRGAWRSIVPGVAKSWT